MTEMSARNSDQEESRVSRWLVGSRTLSIPSGCSIIIPRLSAPRKKKASPLPCIVSVPPIWRQHASCGPVQLNMSPDRA